MGKKENETYVETIDADVISYWNEEHKSVYTDKTLKKSNFLTTQDYETIALKLDRLFPLYGQDARKAGYELPKPFGVKLLNVFQNTTLHMKSFKLDGNDLSTINAILDGDSKYENTTYVPMLRADMWVLPFLDLSLLFGVANTNTVVTLHSKSGYTLKPPLPPIELIEPNSSTTFGDIETHSPILGLGVTVAGGIDNFFSTIDFQYLFSYTPEAKAKTNMLVVTPLFGYNFIDIATQIYGGAQYQDIKDEMPFEVTDDNGRVLKGSVELYTYEWAGVLGVNYNITRRWDTNVMISYGEDIKNLTIGIGYRW